MANSVTTTNTNVTNLYNSLTGTNSNVANLTAGLANTNSNVAAVASNVTVLQGNVTSLSGAVTSLSGNVYGNANVAAYLPTYSGALNNVGNVTVNGNLSVTGSLTFNNITSATTSNLYLNLASTSNTSGAVNGAGLVIGNIQGNNTSITRFTYSNAVGGWTTDTSINPYLSNAIDLGNAAQRWETVYAVNLNATGNLTLGGNLTAGNLSLTGTTTAGNLATAGYVSAAGTVYGASANIAGNVQAGNIRTTGSISAAGNINLGNATATGNITAAYFLGNANIQYTANTAPPATGNLIGAQWFNTATNVLYEYQTDGSANVWIDITGPTIGSNGAVAGSSINNGTSNVVVNTSTITMGVAGSNVVAIAGSGNVTITGLFQAPQSTKTSTSTGTTGQIAWDANYIYVCTAANTWKRIALTGGVF